MRNSDIKYCKETKKYIFSSEAKASRSVNKYEEIERYYFCEHCQGFHTTSQKNSSKTTEDEDLNLKIKKRLRYLQKKENGTLKEEVETIPIKVPKLEGLTIVGRIKLPKEKKSKNKKSKC